MGRDEAVGRGGGGDDRGDVVGAAPGCRCRTDADTLSSMIIGRDPRLSACDRSHAADFGFAESEAAAILQLPDMKLANIDGSTDRYRCARVMAT
jgi:hypothetical protein